MNFVLNGLKNLRFQTLFIVFAFVFALSAVAQTVAPDAAVTSEELKLFVSSLGDLKGLGTLGIVAVVIQGLLLASRSVLSKVLGGWKLLAVVGLSFAGAFVTGLAQGKGWGAVLLDTTVLALGQQFLHQLFTQDYLKKSKK